MQRFADFHHHSASDGERVEKDREEPAHRSPACDRGPADQRALHCVASVPQRVHGDVVALRVAAADDRDVRRHVCTSARAGQRGQRALPVGPGGLLLGRGVDHHVLPAPRVLHGLGVGALLDRARARRERPPPPSERASRASAASRGALIPANARAFWMSRVPCVRSPRSSSPAGRSISAGPRSSTRGSADPTVPLPTRATQRSAPKASGRCAARRASNAMGCFGLGTSHQYRASTSEQLWRFGSGLTAQRQCGMTPAGACTL